MTLKNYSLLCNIAGYIDGLFETRKMGIKITPEQDFKSLQSLQKKIENLLNLERENIDELKLGHTFRDSVKTMVELRAPEIPNSILPKSSSVPIRPLRKRVKRKVTYRGGGSES